MENLRWIFQGLIEKIVIRGKEVHIRTTVDNYLEISEQMKKNIN
jgi:hypothetical protein